MELKLNLIRCLRNCKYSINCTVVELKHFWSQGIAVCVRCINCTVVELKRRTIKICYSSMRSINCTVVELKQRFGNGSAFLIIVLIVPLWNWNTVVQSYRTEKYSINCTVVELKPLWEMLIIISQGKVLIVPLWNWN